MIRKPATGRRGHTCDIDGMVVNHRRVRRVWKEEALTQLGKRKRKWYKGSSVPLGATQVNHVWTYDFIDDRQGNEEPLYILTVEDEHTRRVSGGGWTKHIARSSVKCKEMVTALFGKTREESLSICAVTTVQNSLPWN